MEAPRTSDNRIIPADAGSTRHGQTTDRQNGDHPRGCGEHTYCGWIISELPGSSPRMRGAQAESRSLSVDKRIIPADAGSTGRTISPF